MKFRLFALVFACLSAAAFGQLTLRPDVALPELPAFHPLPAADPAFSDQIAAIVKDTKLDERTPADVNPDGYEEWSSICIVDLADPDHPRVAEWQAENFVYPASAYKLYILGEAVRQVLAGEHSFDEVLTVKEHNVRADSRLEASQKTTVSEVLRLMMQYSDNTAANEAIDLVDRQRASALLRAMGLEGSDITRKYLPRTREDDGYSTVPGTMSSARHFATFLWAVESGAIGGGRGRGLIKGYMAFVQTALARVRAGLPDSATFYAKSGTWNTFSADVGIVEDGKTRYILCVLTALKSDIADPRIADFTRKVHSLLKSQD